MKRNLRDRQVLIVFQVSSVDVLRLPEGEEGVVSKGKGRGIWLRIPSPQPRKEALLRLSILGVCARFCLKKGFCCRRGENGSRLMYPFYR